MRLSNQALGAIMMALQKSLMEQSDIVPVLTGMNFILDYGPPGQPFEDAELLVENPPIVSFEGTEVDNVSDFIDEVLAEEN